MISTEVSLRTQFYDLDPMNIVWHGNYLRYLEEARRRPLERDRLRLSRDGRRRGFVWPSRRTLTRSKYVRPLKLGQQFIVRATLKECENRICIDYRGLDAESRAVLTKARSVQLAVSIATGELSLRDRRQQLIDCVQEPPVIVAGATTCRSASVRLPPSAHTATGRSHLRLASG